MKFRDTTLFVLSKTHPELLSFSSIMQFLTCLHFSRYVFVGASNYLPNSIILQPGNNCTSDVSLSRTTYSKQGSLSMYHVLNCPLLMCQALYYRLKNATHNRAIVRLLLGFLIFCLKENCL